MNDNYKLLLDSSKRKTIQAIKLVKASLENLQPYESEKNYTPKELEPYDALSDRFIRAVESCIKFFKTYEYYLFAENSDTFRDLLMRMEKLNIITSVLIWIDMRDIRNRIVHDYLPNQIKEMYDLIMYHYNKELQHVEHKMQSIN